MNVLTITAGVPPDAVDALRTGCPPGLEIQHEQHVWLNSAAPPTFIQLIADAATWTLVFKIAATAFLAQLGKNAADDLWKSKSMLAEAMRHQAVASFRKFANALRDARARSVASTYVAIGVPLPSNSDFCVQLVVPDSEEDAVTTVALFVLHLPAIEQFLDTQERAGRFYVAHVWASVQDDGSLSLRWCDRASNEHEEFVVRLEAA